MDPDDFASVQKHPTTCKDLQDSYDRLYSKGWLGKHRNDDQIALMIDLVNPGPGRLLDVACGMGFTLPIAEKRGSQAFGLDISFVALRNGKLSSPELNLIQGDGEHLPWASNTFDYIICTGSLEHFLHPEIGVREIARVMKPEGRAAILLPNSHNILAIYNVWKTGGILSERQDFERFATRKEWQYMLESNGLIVETTHKFNVGFARAFKKGREVFWYLYNILFHIFGDRWIPLNLSYNFVFVCRKNIANPNE